MVAWLSSPIVIVGAATQPASCKHDQAEAKYEAKVCMRFAFPFLMAKTSHIRTKQ